MRARTSCFQASRCSCHVPSASRMISATTVLMVRPIGKRGRASDIAAAGLPRLVGELGGDHQALEGAQQPAADDDGQRQPDDQLQPGGGTEGDLGEDGAERDQEAADQNDENGRSVSGVGRFQVEAAGFTGGGHLEEALEQVALAAAGAAARRPSCVRVKSPFSRRMKQTARKMVPISTWKPWKPVAMKKDEPYRPELAASSE